MPEYYFRGSAQHSGEIIVWAHNRREALDKVLAGKTMAYHFSADTFHLDSFKVQDPDWEDEIAERQAPSYKMSDGELQDAFQAWKRAVSLGETVLGQAEWVRSVYGA